METTLTHVWQLINELSEQLVVNQKLAKSLQGQTLSLKTQAVESETGFSLRRFNTDVSKEVFDSELERTSAQIIIENQTLSHENKQLSQLLKEYETTLETIMTKFKNHALAAQQHESTLTRHYETLLQTRETQTLSSDLASAAEMMLSMRRLVHLLRGLLRSLAGEDPNTTDPVFDAGTGQDNEPVNSLDLSQLEHLLETLNERCNGGYNGEECDDWAVEREHEIGRLEKENVELRRMLAIDQESLDMAQVKLDPDRINGGRCLTFLRKGQSGSSDGLSSRPSYWDNPQNGGGPPFQRTADLQPGMRLGQGRRPGILGGGRGRGGLSNLGLGQSPGARDPLWANQSSPPAPTAGTPWQIAT